MLAEVQRIKSEGDYEAGKQLVEQYAVKVDSALNAEVLNRYSALHLAPYGGFVNPTYVLVKNENNEVVDVHVNYSEDYVSQMLRYSKEHSWLPNWN